MRRFFINPQGDLYPTKDVIQYNGDQLAILRRLIPLIRRDFATAARNADQMGACEQETMDLILAHEPELQEEQACQRDPRLHGRDEVDSHADSSRAAGPAPARIDRDGNTSAELRPSTSTVSPDIISSATVTTEEGVMIPVPRNADPRNQSSSRTENLNALWSTGSVCAAAQREVSMTPLP